MRQVSEPFAVLIWTPSNTDADTDIIHFSSQNPAKLSALHQCCFIPYLQLLTAYVRTLVDHVMLDGSSVDNECHYGKF